MDGICYTHPINKTTAYHYHYISSVYIGIPLFVIGICSNVVCIFVWKQLIDRVKNRNISCGVYLITIAVVDTGMITSFFFCESLFYLLEDITTRHSYNVFYAYFGYPAYMFFTFISFWLIAGVDMCRLTMVLFPIKIRQSKQRLTNIAIVLIVSFVFVVNIPNFFAFQARRNKYNGEACRFITKLYIKESFFNYMFWFQCVFLTVFPWCVIVIVNIWLIIRKLTVPDYTPKWRRRGKEMGRVLFWVSIWFVSIIFWQCVAQCFFIKTPKVSSSWDDINRSFAFGKLGMVLNSSTKLYLFLLSSKTFRNRFLRLLHWSSSNNVDKFTTSQKQGRKRKQHKSVNAVLPEVSCTVQMNNVNFTQHNLFNVTDISSIGVKFPRGIKDIAENKQLKIRTQNLRNSSFET